MRSTHRFHTKNFPSVVDWILFIVFFIGILFVFVMMIIGLINETNNKDDRTPEGCVWIDMNPSKGSDYQLACVEGYGWDR